MRRWLILTGLLGVILGVIFTSGRALITRELVVSANPTVQALSESAHVDGLNFSYDDAVARLDEALALEPDNPALYVQRGQMILLLYEWDRVLADYNTALELDPSYPPAYFHRGVLYYTQGPRLSALDDFRRYLALAPGGAFALRAAEYIEDIEREMGANSR